MVPPSVASWSDHDVPAPLLVHNLLNDLTVLGPLLLDALRRGSWLDAYLLAAGLNQIVEDYLHPDPYFLGKAGKYLSRLPAPAGVVAAGAARALNATVMSARGRRAPMRSLLRQQTHLADIVQRLADAVVCPSTVSPSAAEAMCAAGEALVKALEHGPASLLREVLRLPSCFRSFDQQPADLVRIVRDFSRQWADRRRPLLVVGVRTSGSYLAPLYAACLKAHGYQDVGVLTARPGRGLLPGEQARLRSVSRRGGLTLLVDDPPSSAASIARVARDLERGGVPSSSIVLLLQLFGSRDALPSRLQRYASVTLPWDEWAIHAQLAPAAVQAVLHSLLAPGHAVQAIERLALPFRPDPRGHVQALYHARLVERETGRRREQRIFVAGAGLGYFGTHALAVARALPQFSPEVYGFHAGLLYRAWIPAERKLSSPHGQEDTLAAAMVSYVVARRNALRVGEDVSLHLRGRLPVWEAASNLVSHVFGRGWMLARLPVVDPIVTRLLRCADASVVDGSMTPAHWFSGATGATEHGDGGSPNLLKVAADERAFSHLDLYCYDAVFDLASLAASYDLAGLRADVATGAGADAGADPGAAERRLARRLREVYEEVAAEPISAERWLLYQLVHLWDHERRHDGDHPPAPVRRALARALQRYFAETVFADLPAQGQSAGPLCAIDIDGVLETNALGFPGLTPVGARALRALTLHGYRPVLVTGRSLDDVRERCAAYRLAGGVAEYGAVIYNHASGGTRELLSDGDRADLDRLRATLGAAKGVYLDQDYRRAVRAYRLDADGRRRGLSPETVALALATCGLGDRIRPIAGAAQTDFMVATIDKGTGLRVLVDELGPGTRAAGARHVALAVGDSCSDLPMFALATLALAPANADAEVRSAGVRVLRRPYQAGLALAVAQLLGHQPGRCPVCRPPHVSSDTRLLWALLAAQETGTWGIARTALLLAARVWTMDRAACLAQLARLGDTERRWCRR